MTTKTSFFAWRAAMFAALGVSPLVACSSSTSSDGSGSKDGGSGGASDSSAGGASAGGGSSGGASNGGSSSGGGSSGGAGGVLSDAASDAPQDGAVALECKNPVPKTVGGTDTGFVQCDNGAVHRPTKKSCPSILPRNTTCGSGVDSGVAPICTKDQDCVDFANGYCELGGLSGGCVCNYGCTTDADCGPGQLCGCGDVVGTCLTAYCTSDADCEQGFLCISAMDGCGFSFACQRAEDTCMSDADCTNVGEHCGVAPLLTADGAAATGPDGGAILYHTCVAQRPCGTGRPFLVDGDARVAGLSARSDWCSDLAPGLVDLDAGERTLLAQHWTEVGLMEHASIAAFARFALELMSLGAPPSLVTAAQAAMADETVHARDAFALASAYAGRPVGPGLLDVDRAMGSRSAVAIVETAIIEGCIGETVAALEAEEALALSTDPAVCDALRRVAADETRHAELAFRFVQWVLENADRQLRARTLDMLGEAVSGAAALPSFASEASAAVEAHGFLPAALRGEIRRRAIADVVAPCLGALARRAAGRGTVSVSASALYS